MDGFIQWLTTTPLGLATVIGGMVLFFLVVAGIYERGTRKRFPDRSKRKRRRKK